MESFPIPTVGAPNPFIHVRTAKRIVDFLNALMNVVCDGAEWSASDNKVALKIPSSGPGGGTPTQNVVFIQVGEGSVGVFTGTFTISDIEEFSP